LNTSKQIFALLKKDLLLETRQQHTLYGILLYIASTIFVVYLTIDLPDADTWNAIFWITQLFICINAVAKSFLQESRGRMLYYFTITSPVAFILSKLLYNLLLMVVMSSVNLIVYSAMMGNPTISFFSFCLIGILGGCGLGLIFTMLDCYSLQSNATSLVDGHSRISFDSSSTDDAGSTFQNSIWRNFQQRHSFPNDAAFGKF